MIVNNVVHGGPALYVPGHLSYGQFLIDKIRLNSTYENEVALTNGDTGVQITFKQLLRDIASVGTGLKKAGLNRGDVVAICSDNRIEYLSSTVGSLCCGATVTTVSPYYTRDEVKNVLNISRPTFIISTETFLTHHFGVLKSADSIKKIIQIDGRLVESGVVSYSTLLQEVNVEEYMADEVEGMNDVALILYSSGTTGLPKGVMLTHFNALYEAATFDTYTTENSSNYKIYLTVVPWYHAYGLLSTLNYLANDRHLVYLAGFNPEKYLGCIDKYKVNVLLTVPPMVVFLAKSPLVQKFQLSSLNAVWCGAAPLSVEVINLVMKRIPNCKGVFQAYGMTETSLSATKDFDVDNPRFKIPKPGSGGFPVNGMKMKVVDVESRHKLGLKEKGEVCFKGPIVMKGYAGNEAATRDVMDDEGYLKTGDIGYYDEDGFIFIVDRLKELIKYKGNQVPPALIESVLLQHPAVAECGVVGAPDETAGELATAFVVLRQGANVSQRELLDFSAAKLSVVNRLHGGIIFAKDIPKNPSGKILRRLLKGRLTEKMQSKL